MCMNCTPNLYMLWARELCSFGSVYRLDIKKEIEIEIEIIPKMTYTKKKSTHDSLRKIENLESRSTKVKLWGREFSD